MKDIKYNKDEEIEKEYTENNEKTEEIIEDIVFEELDGEGEELGEKEKSKRQKDKLKEKFENKIKRLEKERDEYLRGWQRAQADYKNREKELEDYKKNIVKFANENLVKEILPVLDGYDSARRNKEHWENVNPDWRIGVEYLFSQFIDILYDAGVIVFGEIGEEYDPNFHEAIETELVEDKKDIDKITTVLQKGYRMGNKILRAAKVKVGKQEQD